MSSAQLSEAPARRSTRGPARWRAHVVPAAPSPWSPRAGRPSARPAWGDLVHQPVAGVSAAEFPAAEFPAAELPAAELPAAELPAAELPAAGGVGSPTLRSVAPVRDTRWPGATRLPVRDARPVGRPGLRLLDEGCARPSVTGGCPARSAPPRPRRDPVSPCRPPLRLTRRGRRAVAALSIATGLTIAAGTVAVALAGAGAGLELAGRGSVVVEHGDTLWSIARSVAPERDARGVVDALQETNGLASTVLIPGQVLQLP